MAELPLGVFNFDWKGNYLGLHQNGLIKLVKNHNEMQGDFILDTVSATIGRNQTTKNEAVYKL